MNRYLFLIGFLIIGTFTSCEKRVEPDLTANPFAPTPGTPITGWGTFSYEADGIGINVTTVQALEVVDVASSESSISIQGTSANQSLILWIDPNTTPGTYELDENAFEYWMALQKIATPLKLWISEGSNPIPTEVTITLHDKSNRHLVGTFYGSVIEQDDNSVVNITNGSFDVYYGKIFN